MKLLYILIFSLFSVIAFADFAILYPGEKASNGTCGVYFGVTENGKLLNYPDIDGFRYGGSCYYSFDDAKNSYLNYFLVTNTRTTPNISGKAILYPGQKDILGKSCGVNFGLMENGTILNLPNIDGKRYGGGCYYNLDDAKKDN